MGELHDKIWYKRWYKIYGNLPGRGSVFSDDESSACGFFEVPVPESNTALGFISGIFSKAQKSSSFSSEACNSQEVFFFSDVRILI